MAADLLKNQPNIKIKLRAVDPEGNFSDEVNLELISKERKYEILENALIGEATFKCPDDTEGLVAVLKSVIKYGVRKKILNTERAQKIEAHLNDLTKEG